MARKKRTEPQKTPASKTGNAQTRREATVNPKRAKKRSKNISSKNISVLIADDEPNMRKTLSAILRRQGYEVSTADDGDAAVQMCAEKGFDVVLLDVRMPGIDGVEAFRQIRRHQEGVRVVLMSAYGMDALKPSLLDEGVIAFLSKPLDLDYLLTLLQIIKGQKASNVIRKPGERKSQDH